MLFPEKKSALVRLIDSVKLSLDLCATYAKDALVVYERNREAFTQMREMASRHSDPEVTRDAILRVVSRIPESDFRAGQETQLRLHSQSLSATLLSCFALESYINSLAYFLFQETDILAQSPSARRASAAIVIEALERMSTRLKWQRIGHLRDGEGFKTNERPYQDFKALFDFRDDIVHDKVVPYRDKGSAMPYNGRFPDPVLGSLDLGHALFAAETYWSMVTHVHELVGVPLEQFARHYNLSPWLGEEQHVELVKLSAEYSAKLRPSERHGA